MSIFSRIFGKGEGEGGDGTSGEDGGGIRCPNCGTRSAVDAAFCGECGTTLKSDPARATARRQTAASEKAPPSNARPPLAPQTVNTLHQPPPRDPRSTAPIVASRGAPQRRKSSRPPATQAAQVALPPPPPPRVPAAAPSEPKALTLDPISDRPPVGAPVAAPPTKQEPRATKAQKPVAKGNAASAPKPTRSPSTENLDKMLEEFDVGFEALQSMPAQPPAQPAAPRPEDVAAARELFEAIAANYVRPVRSFVLELKWCDAPESWLEVCLPTLRAVKVSSDKLGLTELSAGIEGLVTELSTLPAAKDAQTASEAKQRVAAAYAKLCLVAPNLFGVEEERHRREPVIVQALLKQIPDIRQLELERIYGSGLSTLDTLFLAKPEDLAQTAGISIELAKQIVDVFQAYKGQLRGDAFAAEQKALRALVAQLKKENAEYERVEKSWSEADKEAKKRLRKERQATFQRINVVLARIGEIDRMNQLERASFTQKISGLEAFLEEAKRASSLP